MQLTERGPTVAKTRVFISFDYDYDLDLKTLLVGQAKHGDSPFEIADWSVKDESKTWKEDARKRSHGSAPRTSWRSSAASTPTRPPGSPLR